MIDYELNLAIDKAIKEVTKIESKIKNKPNKIMFVVTVDREKKTVELEILESKKKGPNVFRNAEVRTFYEHGMYELHSDGSLRAILPKDNTLILYNPGIPSAV